MWKIGLEWAQQQPKNTSARTMNCGDRNAGPREVTTPGVGGGAPAPLARPGARRTNSAAGIRRHQAATPMTSIAVRQSEAEISQRANGDTVIGATPMPAETKETARARFFSNQVVTVAISG